jgi:hypothetical protein
MNSANEPLSCDRKETREMSDQIEGSKSGTPKKKLSWKERLAQLPEEEAKALRAKAAEASRISKAKKKGYDFPQQATVTKLEAALAKTDEKLASLKEIKTSLTAELKAAKAELAVAEKAKADKDAEKAQAQTEQETTDEQA